MSEAPAIRLSHLTKEYGGVRALDDVSLDVERGEVFGYLGPNGAGKTTTLKLLAGLLRPTSGAAFVAGHSVSDAPLQAKARFGYIPESGALFEKLSPREYLAFIARLYRLEDADAAARIERWLAYFDLAAVVDKRMTAFSKGMKQKVCWIAALLHDPEVLILDEPLSGLDVETVARVKELLRQIAASGGTVFYSSHLVDIVEKVCTRIAILGKGRLAAVGTVEAILAETGATSLEQALLALQARS
jgi:ABC-2 type transport system ATP-binding protein